MAKIVAGFASSHTPLMSLPGQDWAKRAEDDKRNRELIRPRDGAHVTYDELLASADPKIAEHIDQDIFVRKFDCIQQSLNELQDTFAQVNPDVVVMFGDDQDELFFEDNYPMISVYWGDILTHYPRITTRPGMSEAIRISSSVYGSDQGMAHAFSFPVCRWFAGKRPPMLPITINTCYPPNWISPRRAFGLGRAVREAIEAWDSDARVAVVTSGGLSHFTVDEDIDRMALEGLTKADGQILSSLPRYKLQSATTEILNWVAAAGALGETPMDLITYQPGYRSPAGTGCGCAVGRWIPE